MIKSEPQPAAHEEPALPAAAQLAEQSDLTAANLVELDDEAKQVEYRRQFALQMQRRGCAGCGD